MLKGFISTSGLPQEAGVIIRDHSHEGMLESQRLFADCQSAQPELLSLDKLVLRVIQYCQVIEDACKRWMLVAMRLLDNGTGTQQERFSF